MANIDEYINKNPIEQEHLPEEIEKLLYFIEKIQSRFEYDTTEYEEMTQLFYEINRIIQFLLEQYVSNHKRIIAECERYVEEIVSIYEDESEEMKDLYDSKDILKQKMLEYKESETLKLAQEQEVLERIVTKHSESDLLPPQIKRLIEQGLVRDMGDGTVRALTGLSSILQASKSDENSGLLSRLENEQVHAIIKKSDGKDYSKNSIRQARL